MNEPTTGRAEDEQIGPPEEGRKVRAETEDNDDGPEPPPCRRCSSPRTTTVSARGVVRTWCPRCTRERYRRWLGTNRDRRRETQRRYEREGRHGEQDVAPGRPTVEAVRARYLNPESDEHRDAMAEAVEVVRLGGTVAEAVDAVLGVVTLAELEAALKAAEGDAALCAAA